MSITGWWWSLIVLLLLAPFEVLAGGNTRSYWQSVDQFAPEVERAEAWVRPARGSHVTVDIDGLKALLAKAPQERTPWSFGEGATIELPMPEGPFERFEVFESPVMAPGLQALYPQMRTYVGRGLDTPGATLRLDVTPRGVSAQILTTRGTVRIDPYSRNNATAHTSYFARDVAPRGHAWSCGAHEGPGLLMEDAPSTRSSGPTTGDTRRTYRLAVAATAEYTALQGGTTQAMNAIVTLVNSLNGLYEVEANIRFVLVETNSQIIFTDALTDPYTNSDNNAMLGENQTAIDTIVGAANYDIGHVFGTANGGIANIGVVCTNGFKAKGVSASPFAPTDPYSVQTFCHEVGHQFNARHTFNGTQGGCVPAQRSSSDAYEPGSGSTLMSYASFCAADNVSANYGDLYLNAQSLHRINGWANGAGSCATTAATGNTGPQVDAGPDFAIPAFTPFVLVASGSDVDLDVVTYCWEERDLGPAQSLAAGDTGTGPIIRSRPATGSGLRSVPRLSDLLSGTPAAGEIVPTTTRTLSFRVTARDNHAGAGGIACDDLDIEVVGSAGPFRVSSPNTNVSWTPGLHTVVWDVAGTDLAPISCATIRILYSTDGGVTFPTTLASGVANTGSAEVTIPAGPTSQARIRIEAEGNHFFDVSDVNFTIPCEAPVSIGATETFCDHVEVSWAPVVGATGYSVWRGTTATPGSASLLGSTATPMFTDSTGVAGTVYHYFVSTVAPSCTSGLSAPDQGTRLALQPVGTVTATTTVCASVELSWPAFGGATSYQVRRNTSNSLIGATILGSPASPAWSDTTAVPGQMYFYFVRAQTASCGFSPYASVTQGWRPVVAEVPTNIVATDLAHCDHIGVSWSASVGATGYEVYRSTVEAFETAVLVASPAVTSFDDTTAIAGTPYFYFIVATSPCGPSAHSASDSGTRRRAVTIQTEPTSVSLCPGEEAMFTIAADGSGTLAFQWFAGVEPIGTDAPSLSIPDVTIANDGTIIRCEVTNPCGTVVSSSVVLSVRVCGPVLYVDSSATGMGDGATWGSAFVSLAEALAYAATEPLITTIKVATGTHTPHENDRASSFSPRTGLVILGGYPAGGGTDDVRDPKAFPVVLSGDLLGDDGAGFTGRSENSWHVVSVGAPDITIDGVVIRGGNANDAAPADAGGGVLVSALGTLSLRNTILTDSAAITRGGGAYVVGALTIEQCTALGNTAAQGGGIATEGVLKATNTTISGNAATSVELGEGGGGVLLLTGSDAELLHCTIAFNSAASDGGGLLCAGGVGSTAACVIANNLASSSPDVSGDLSSAGFNVIGTAVGATGLDATDVAGMDARLLSLNDNGGSTPTHALGAYSIAIDLVDGECEVEIDQRGVPRPIAGTIDGVPRCDAGAIEVGSQPAACPVDLSDTGGLAYPDGGVDINDLLFFLARFEQGDVLVDLDDGSGTGTLDGGVDINDLLYFLTHFESGC